MVDDIRHRQLVDAFLAGEIGLDDVTRRLPGALAGSPATAEDHRAYLDHLKASGRLPPQVHALLRTVQPAAAPDPDDGFGTTPMLAGVASDGSKRKRRDGPSPLAQLLSDAMPARTIVPRRTTGTGTPSIEARAETGANSVASPADLLRAANDTPAPTPDPAPRRSSLLSAFRRSAAAEPAATSPAGVTRAVETPPGDARSANQPPPSFDTEPVARTGADPSPYPRFSIAPSSADAVPPAPSSTASSTTAPVADATAAVPTPSEPRKTIPDGYQIEVPPTTPAPAPAANRSTQILPDDYDPMEGLSPPPPSIVPPPAPAEPKAAAPTPAISAREASDAAVPIVSKQAEAPPAAPTATVADAVPEDEEDEEDTENRIVPAHARTAALTEGDEKDKADDKGQTPSGDSEAGRPVAPPILAIAPTPVDVKEEDDGIDARRDPARDRAGPDADGPDADGPVGADGARAEEDLREKEHEAHTREDDTREDDNREIEDEEDNEAGEARAAEAGMEKDRDEDDEEGNVHDDRDRHERNSETGGDRDRNAGDGDGDSSDPRRPGEPLPSSLLPEATLDTAREAPPDYPVPSRRQGGGGVPLPTVTPASGSFGLGRRSETPAASTGVGDATDPAAGEESVAADLDAPGDTDTAPSETERQVDEAIFSSYLNTYRKLKDQRAQAGEQSEQQKLDALLQPWQTIRFRRDAAKLADGDSAAVGDFGLEDEPGPSEVGPGDIVNKRFVIERVLGEGGMGTVFKAVDRRQLEAKSPNPFVALKLLSHDFRRHPEAYRALERETRKSQILAHPNIVTVFDFDRDGRLAYMTMELLEGSPLSKLINAHGSAMDWATAEPIIRGVGAALSYAHEQGIVHADIKPGNIFYTTDGRVKLLDFGIAQAFRETGTANISGTGSDSLAGALTPSFASVEMLEGMPAAPKDDIYALACVIYEMLAGRHPFDSKTASEAEAHGDNPAPIPGLSKKQNAALAHGLAFRRENRPVTMQSFIEELIDLKRGWFGR